MPATASLTVNIITHKLVFIKHLLQVLYRVMPVTVLVQ